MTTHVALFINREFIYSLLNAILRPMFCRYKDAQRVGDMARFQRCQLFFLRMLDACDCYPFCIEAGQGLFILDEPSKEDDHDMIDEYYNVA